jgi:hypothetical protein
MDVRIAVTPHQRQTFEPVTLGQIRATNPLFSAFFSRGGHVMSVFYALRRLPLSASALIEDALAGAPSGESVLVIDVGGTSVKILASGQSGIRSFLSGPTLTPGQMVARVQKLAGDWRYDVVSIGYPGRAQEPTHARPAEEAT